MSLAVLGLRGPAVHRCSGWRLRHWCAGISGLVVEYIVAIDVTRVRFPADACITVPMVLCSYGVGRSVPALFEGAMQLQKSVVV